MRVRLLGRVAVEVDGRWRDDWPRPAARRLVVLLVLAPTHRLGREVIAERLFGHLPPDRALRNVSKALSQARVVVGGAALRADQGSIWLDEDLRVESDLDRAVGQLEQAAVLAATEPGRAQLRATLASCGDLLSDDAYEEWAQEPSRRVERLADAARLALARAGGSPGDWLDVAASRPDCDEAWRALLREAADRGDRRRLTDTYRRYRRSVRDQLGAEPSDDVRETYTALRVGIGRSTPGPEEPRTHGRAREVGMLDAVAGQAALGSGTSALLIGPAGIGKSHLLTTTARRSVAAGYRVAHASCMAGDDSVPLSALRAALLSVPQAGTTTRLSGMLEGNASAAGVQREPAAVAQLAEAVHTLLDDLDDPALLILDDVQWADESLQLVLMRLAADTRPRQWSLLMAARSDEPGRALPAVPSACQVVALHPLAATDATAVARDVLSGQPPADPAAQAALISVMVERSAGNPFFLTELIRAVPEGRLSADGASPAPVPERIVALLRSRLTACSATAQAALTTVVLVGDSVSHPLLERMIGTDAEGVVDVLAELSQRHLVEQVAGRPRVIHPLLREAAVSQLDVLAICTAHTRIADTLADLGGTSSSAGTELEIARHRLAAYAAVPSPELAASAAEAGLVAGGRAMRMFATRPAARILAMALDACAGASRHDRQALRGRAVRGLLDLGHCRHVLGDVAGALTSYEQALRDAATAADVARATRALAGVHYRAGRLAAFSATLRTGLDKISAEESIPRALLELEIAWGQHRTGHLVEAQPVLERVAEQLEDCGDWALAARSLDRLAMNLAALHRHGEALAVLDRAQAADEKTPLGHQRGILLMHRANPLMALGRLDEALDAVSRGSAILEKSNDRYGLSVSEWIRADLHAERGEPELALAAREREIGLLGDIGNNFNLAPAHAHRAELLRELGRTGQAEAAAALARKAARCCGDPSLIEAVDNRLNGGNMPGTPSA